MTGEEIAFSQKDQWNYIDILSDPLTLADSCWLVLASVCILVLARDG
jgi:hypothetical protein